jgi:hypothetical protein
VKIIKGKLRGQVVKLRQWSNDWMTADTDNGAPLVLKPPMVELDDDECRRMQADYLRYQQDGSWHRGFWRAWRLGADGRFIRREQAE